MKLAFTGAHGVGKSTLAYYLKNKLKGKGIDSIVTPEVPRLICEAANNKEYFRRGNNTLLKQFLIIIGQLVEEHDWKKSNFQICDRTLLDHWAYSLNLFGKEIEKESLSEIFEIFLTKHCRTYDKIFYIPNEIKPIDDGVREEDLTFQDEIDNLIVKLLNKYNLQFITITGTVENRCNIILESLNLL